MLMVTQVFGNCLVRWTGLERAVSPASVCKLVVVAPFGPVLLERVLPCDERSTRLIEGALSASARRGLNESTDPDMSLRSPATVAIPSAIGSTGMYHSEV